MDIGLQAKILRVLQEREVERLGSRKTMKLDVRVIATTNRDLRQHVREGNFREDLYYRLSVFPLAWLPLRQRRQDIVPLAERLLEQHAGRMGRSTVRLDEQAKLTLSQYAWPGNVRELDNVLQRALIIQDGHTITASCLGLEQGQTHRFAGTVSNGAVSSSAGSHSVTVPVTAQEADGSDDNRPLGNDLKQREFEIILSTLKQQGGRRKETAEVLGVSARTLRYKLARMRDMGINIDSLVSA